MEDSLRKRLGGLSQLVSEETLVASTDLINIPDPFSWLWVYGLQILQYLVRLGPVYFLQERMKEQFL